jgi:deoxyadenosine/deoxycytidine kinase
MYNFICIEGNIGAGKTTLAQMLSKERGARLIEEQFEDNSFLPKFYADPTRYAFPLETSFLAARFNQLKNLLNNLDLFNQLTISDYALFKSLVFARTNLEDDEYMLFMKLYEIIEKQIPLPELIVYLYRPVPKLLYHIQKRGRSYEAEIPPAYLEKINETYLEHFRSLTDTRILLLRADNLNYVDSEVDYNHIKSLIFKDYPLGLSFVE